MCPWYSSHQASQAQTTVSAWWRGYRAQHVRGLRQQTDGLGGPAAHGQLDPQVAHAAPDEFPADNGRADRRVGAR